MSYRRSWSRQFYPDEYYIEGAYGCPTPVICPDHKDETGRSVCHKIGVGISIPGVYVGTWYMNTPLKVADVMPGENAKILSVSAKAMAIPGGWGSWWHDVSNILLLLLGDRTELWRSGQLYIPERQWGLNTLAVNKALSQADSFMISLYQKFILEIGEWYGHVAEIKLDGEYYTVEAPPTASVRITVKNKDTGGLVGKARVAIMSGAVVIADGYTDGGEITFNNVDEGSYTLRISAGGYYSFEYSIDVVAPSVWYTASLVPIPITPLPDWVKYVGVGLAALTAIAVVPPLLRKEKAPVVVEVKK